MVQPSTRHELLAELLAHGELRIPAQGDSMLPVLWPGDLLVVRAADPGRLRPGGVVVAVQRDGLVAHRLVRRRGDRLWLRGDAQTGLEPVAIDDVVGVVTAYVPAGGEERSLESWRWRVAGQVLVWAGPLVAAAQARARRMLPGALRRTLRELIGRGHRA